MTKKALMLSWTHAVSESDYRWPEEVAENVPEYKGQNPESMGHPHPWSMPELLARRRRILKTRLERGRA